MHYNGSNWLFHGKSRSPFLRICDFCKTQQNSETGIKVLSSNKLNYKWQCARCTEWNKRYENK